MRSCYRFVFALAIGGCASPRLGVGGPSAAPTPDAGATAPSVPTGPDCSDPANQTLCQAAPDTMTSFGVDGAPFDKGDDGSAGVTLDGGKVSLDGAGIASKLPPLIWVANSGEGTISKIDTRSMKELARYRTGPLGASTNMPDPSRTTVGMSGDVVVANRGGSSATRIASDPSRCGDKNGNGQIETSTGPTDVKDWGKDECVLWNTAFTPGALGRAAAFDAQIGPDGEDASKVWIGLWTTSQVLQLDPKDGAILDTVDVSPVKPYGAAVDRSGNVYVWGEHVAKIDSNHKVTQLPDPPCAYGIAVDEKGRVWTSGNACVARFDPATNQWDKATVGTDNRGLALDGRGSVWIADTDFGIHQVDEETMAVKKDLFLPYSVFVGVAVDADHKVWAISRNNSTALRITPEGWVVDPIAVGSMPYTYSDMTGFQLRNAAAPSGRWRHVFDGCNDRATTMFGKLDIKATTPPGTSLRINARSAANRDALASAAWMPIATLPPDTSPIDLQAKMQGANMAGVMEIEVVFQTVSLNQTPSLDGLSLGMDCHPVIQ